MIITPQMVLIIRKSLQIKRKITMTMIWVMKMIISCCCINDVIDGDSGGDRYKIDLLSHLSLNREGRWGIADDFATNFLHFSLFSIALWDLANSRSVVSPPLPLSVLALQIFLLSDKSQFANDSGCHAVLRCSLC